MKKNYVPTTLGQYLNENRSITLTRKYGEKEPVVVGSRAPLRNAVLSYVAENVKVTRATLKKFVAGLNETSKNPNAAANMWLKRNAKFFITESKGGVTTYKLSKLGEKLMSVTHRTTTGALSEETRVKSLNEKKDHDFKDEKTGKKGITDEDDVDEECNEETREERVARIVEQIKAKRAAALNEADDDDEKPADDDDDEKPVDDDDDDDEKPADDDNTGSDAAADDFEMADDIDTEAVDDDRVEITEFIITVDDVASAIEELGELGVEASEVSDELAEPADDMDMDLGAPEGDDLNLGDEEVADFDLDLGGDLEGEEVAGEEEVLEPEVEESVTGMEKEEKRMDPNLTEKGEDDEFKMDDLEDFGTEEEELPSDDLVGDEVATDDEELPVDTPEDGGEGDDLNFDDEAPIEGGETQIKVDASNWDVLKGWLEGKGVDIEEMFGGEIEVEGEEGLEDEISFDDLEDTEEEKAAPVVDDDEDVENDDDDDNDDDDKDDVDEATKVSTTGYQPSEEDVDKKYGVDKKK